MSGLGTTQCDLEGSHGADEHLRRIAAYGAAHPDREWVVGGGWSMNDFPGGTPTAAALDAVVPDRPAVLTNRDYHGAWVNSRALELAGITAATPDPAGGRIERDAHGAPLGTLQEQAMHLVLDRTPAPTHAERVAGIRAGQDYYHRLGITACQDALVDADWQRAYEHLARSGELGLRVRGALEWDAGRGDEQLAELRRAAGERQRRAGSRAATSSSSTTAWSRTAPRPCSTRTWTTPGGRPAEYGIDMYARGRPGAVRAACATRPASASTSTRSATGRCASRSTRSRPPIGRNGRRDARHQLAHVQFAHPDDLPRFARARA